jgi:cell wall-associated NlpC family hydrolase
MQHPHVAVTVNKRVQIVKKAEELAVAYRSSKYQMGGKTTEAFDCSYFVYLVFSSIFPAYTYLNSEAMISGPFKLATRPSPGDVIFFGKGQVPYELNKKKNVQEFPNHVGIVLDSSSWVGRQSSGLGLVYFNDVWWWPRGPKFYSYEKFDSAHVSYFASDARKGVA